ncbi:winged helix DNA-binding protein [Parasphingopyxis marina]|uniref:Winged helix DNA-binding protein n=1 Tax=Parasphingopyxis marina TaxID=2761622 RepID=A0A842I0Y7_9SPHN|nr:winged helix DNA-binding protein [Parasphingopyxis marina]MBC2778353.1 winged helix DNA-binding protein [Parasphingopyxis marina]
MVDNENGEPDIGQASSASAVAIVCDSAAAENRCRLVAEAARVRVVTSTAPGEALDRLSGPIGLDVVMVEIGQDHGAALDALVAELSRSAKAGRYRSVVSVPMDLVDIVDAAIGHGDVTLLCPPNEMDCALALGEALSRRSLALHDIGSEHGETRLQRLSEEVGRIARALEELTHDDGPRGDRHLSEARPAFRTAPRTLGADHIRAKIRMRRLRARFFDEDLFADPAWDMLLDLMAARLEGRQVAVSSLCIAAAVPPTTALRWIRTMTERGLFVRHSDPRDGRRVFIDLSDEATQAMERWFAALGENGEG